jgi:hypothetical protein
VEQHLLVFSHRVRRGADEWVAFYVARPLTATGKATKIAANVNVRTKTIVVVLFVFSIFSPIPKFLFELKLQ